MGYDEDDDNELDIVKQNTKKLEIKKKQQVKLRSRKDIIAQSQSGKRDSIVASGASFVVSRLVRARP